jgi:hypothetical protein
MASARWATVLIAADDHPVGDALCGVIRRARTDAPRASLDVLDGPKAYAALEHRETIHPFVLHRLVRECHLGDESSADAATRQEAFVVSGKLRLAGPDASARTRCRTRRPSIHPAPGRVNPLQLPGSVGPRARDHVVSDAQQKSVTHPCLKDSGVAISVEVQPSETQLRRAWCLLDQDDVVCDRLGPPALVTFSDERRDRSEVMSVGDLGPSPQGPQAWGCASSPTLIPLCRLLLRLGARGGVVAHGGLLACRVWLGSIRSACLRAPARPWTSRHNGTARPRVWSRRVQRTP